LSRESEHGPSGIGTLQHVAGKLFKMMTGVNMVSRALSQRASLTHRPDRRASTRHVRQHDSIVRVHRFEYGGWSGIGAPTGTPPKFIDKLNREINIALADPKMMARFAEELSRVMLKFAKRSLPVEMLGSPAGEDHSPSGPQPSPPGCLNPN
jgi:hypothetical protein